MIICSCHNLNHLELEDFIKKNPHCTQAQVSQKTKAGTDCGICIETINEILISLGKSKGKNNNIDKYNYWGHP